MTTYFLLFCLVIRLFGFLVIFRFRERNDPIFPIIRTIVKKCIFSITHPQLSHIASPCIVLGALHQTLDIRVEHAAHWAFFVSLMSSPKSDASASEDAFDPDRARIRPSEGAPSVLFCLACAVLTLRCCRMASFSALSCLFFQMYEYRSTIAGRLSRSLPVSCVSSPPCRSNSLSKVETSKSDSC
jgi:hypothetical protein